MGGGSGRRKDSPCFVAETIVRDLSEISRGGGGGGNRRGGSQLFEPQKREGS